MESDWNNHCDVRTGRCSTTCTHPDRPSMINKDNGHYSKVVAMVSYCIML